MIPLPKNKEKKSSQRPPGNENKPEILNWLLLSKGRSHIKLFHQVRLQQATHAPETEAEWGGLGRAVEAGYKLRSNYSYLLGPQEYFKKNILNLEIRHLELRFINSIYYLLLSKTNKNEWNCAHF